MTPATQTQTILLVAATVGFLAFRIEEPDRGCLTRVCVALLVFAAYRWACESIAIVWWAGDQSGRLLGKLAGWLANRPLEVGASFAGLDFLVLGSTFLGLASDAKTTRRLWSRLSRSSRGRNDCSRSAVRSVR